MDAKLAKLQAKLRGTAMDMSEWPRTIFAKPDGNARLRLHPVRSPLEGPLPALDADEVTRLIRCLVELRAHMVPKPPARRPGMVPFSVHGGVRVAARRAEGMVMLDLRTDGFGWTSIVVPPAALRQLLRDLVAIVPPETDAGRATRAAPARGGARAPRRAAK